MDLYGLFYGGNDVASNENACVGRGPFRLCAGTASVSPDPGWLEPEPQAGVSTAVRSWQCVNKRQADLCTCLPFIMCCQWDWDYIGLYGLAQLPGQWGTKLRLSQNKWWLTVETCMFVHLDLSNQIPVFTLNGW